MFATSYHLHWIAGRANILRKYIIYIFFNFGRSFCVSFSMLFPKAPTSCCKEFWTNFCCIVFYINELKKCVSHIFKSLFQTGDINLFIVRGVFFSRYLQLKSSFTDKKKNQRKVLKENSINGIIWSSAMLFIVQNFLVSLSSRCAHVLSL